MHTPLMSGSNFVHGVVLVGAMVALGNADPNDPLQLAIGFFAVLLGAILAEDCRDRDAWTSAAEASVADQLHLLGLTSA